MFVFFNFFNTFNKQQKYNFVELQYNGIIFLLFNFFHPICKNGNMISYKGIHSEFKSGATLQSRVNQWL